MRFSTLSTFVLLSLQKWNSKRNGKQQVQFSEVCFRAYSSKYMCRHAATDMSRSSQNKVPSVTINLFIIYSHFSLCSVNLVYYSAFICFGNFLNNLVAYVPFCQENHFTKCIHPHYCLSCFPMNSMYSNSDFPAGVARCECSWALWWPKMQSFLCCKA